MHALQPAIETWIVKAVSLCKYKNMVPYIPVITGLSGQDNFKANGFFDIFPFMSMCK